MFIKTYSRSIPVKVNTIDRVVHIIDKCKDAVTRYILLKKYIIEGNERVVLAILNHTCREDIEPVHLNLIAKHGMRQVINMLLKKMRNDSVYDCILMMEKTDDNLKWIRNWIVENPSYCHVTQYRRCIAYNLEHKILGGLVPVAQSQLKQELQFWLDNFKLYTKNGHFNDKIVSKFIDQIGYIYNLNLEGSFHTGSPILTEHISTFLRIIMKIINLETVKMVYGSRFFKTFIQDIESELFRIAIKNDRFEVVKWVYENTDIRRHQPFNNQLLNDIIRSGNLTMYTFLKKPYHLDIIWKRTGEEGVSHLRNALYSNNMDMIKLVEQMLMSNTEFNYDIEAGGDYDLCFSYVLDDLKFEKDILSHLLTKIIDEDLLKMLLVYMISTFHKPTIDNAIKSIREDELYDLLDHSFFDDTMSEYEYKMREGIVSDISGYIHFLDQLKEHIDLNFVYDCAFHIDILRWLHNQGFTNWISSESITSRYGYLRILSLMKYLTSQGYLEMIDYVIKKFIHIYMCLSDNSDIVNMRNGLKVLINNIEEETSSRHQIHIVKYLKSRFKVFNV